MPECGVRGRSCPTQWQTSRAVDSVAIETVAARHAVGDSSAWDTEQDEGWRPDHGSPRSSMFPRRPCGSWSVRACGRVLQGVLDHPVTLVCGPAGSGKTSLLSTEVAQLGGVARAWVSLSPAETESGRFWTTVLASLRASGAVPDGSSLDALAPPVRESARTFMPLLVNALAELPEPVVLVLDDLHVVRSRETLDQLAFLVLHAPATIRLVLSARSDPALPLHLLRVSGHLLELRGADLAFTAEEAEQLFAVHDVELPGELVQAAVGPDGGVERGPAARGAEPAGPRRPRRASWRSSRATTGRWATTSSPRCSTGSPRASGASSCRRRSWSASRASWRTRSRRGSRGPRRSTRSSRASASSSAWTRGGSGTATTASSPRSCVRAHGRRSPTSSPRCTAARRDGTPARATTRRRCSTRSRRPTGSSPSSSPRATGSTSSSPARATRCARSWPRCPPNAWSATPSSPRRSPAPRSPRGTPSRRGRTSATPSAPPGSCRPARRRAYLETMALARLYLARRDGDFQAALAAADHLLREADEPRRLVARRAARARARGPGRGRVLGPPPGSRAGGAHRGRAHRPRRSASTTSRSRR